MFRFAVLLLFAGAMFHADARKVHTSAAFAPWLEMQPSAHMKGADIAFTDTLNDSIYNVKTYYGDSTYAKCVTVSDTGDTGTLWVHCVDDPDTSFVALELMRGREVSRVFNKVHQRSTITLSGITLWLVPHLSIIR